MATVSRLGIDTQTPTTEEALAQAAAIVQPLLPRNFWGEVKLIWEDGRYKQVSVYQTYMVKRAAKP